MPVEFRHHRPRGAVGIGQHDGVGVGVAVPGEQGTDPGVAAFLVKRRSAELQAEAVTDSGRPERPAGSGSPPELTADFLTPQVARDAQVRFGFGLEFRRSTLYKEGSNAGVSALLTRYGNADADAVVLSNTDGAAWPVMAELNRRYES